MSTSSNIKKPWYQFLAHTNSKTVVIVAQRFIQLFLDHGVKITQISRLLPAIKLDNLKSEEALLAVLTPEILAQTAQLFGVRLEWLEGVDDTIYEYLSCYKRPSQLLDNLANVIDGVDVGLSFPLRVLATTKRLNCNVDGDQLLAPIIVEKVASLGEEEIYRYHIYRDGFNWGYSPGRIELKAIARTVYKNLHTPVPLFDISDKEMRSLLDGELIPTELFRGALLTNPSFEDFSLTKDESRVALESEEISDVLNYITEYNLHDFSFDKRDKSNQPDEPISSSAPCSPSEINKDPNEAGKRAKNRQDLWEPVKAVASAIWIEDKSQSIAEVIIRIKKMPHLKAASLTESAIRKHIAGLAPPDIRGKSGRKPQKST